MIVVICWAFISNATKQNKGTVGKSKTIFPPEENRDYYFFEDEIKIVADRSFFYIATTPYNKDGQNGVKYWYVKKEDNDFGTLISELEKERILRFMNVNPMKIYDLLNKYYTDRSTIHIVKR